MLVKSALAAALAATAHSFVIIPDVAPADSAFSEVAPLNPSENLRAVSVDCPGCPVSVQGPDGAAIATDAPNHLEMTFSIDASPAGDRLLANGFELYPNPDPFSSPLAAAQVVEGSDGKPGEEQTLGYKLQVFPLAKDQESQFIEVIGVDLQVIEVGGAFVDGIPLVKVLLGKKGDNLAIMDVETFGSTAKADPAAECTTWMCRLRAFVAKKLSMFRRPCPGKGKMGGFHGPHHGMHRPGHHHGHHGHHGKPNDIAMPQGGPPKMHHGPPGHPHKHHHGHHHGPSPSRNSSFFWTFALIITNIMFPILLGIFVGASVGLLVMAVMSASAVVYGVVRGRRSQQQNHKAGPTEVADEEEKDGLMEGQEPIDAPPSYSEQPEAPRV